MPKSLIQAVPVPQSEATAEEPWRACSWVGYFVEEARSRGYHEDELPPDAVCFALLWEYHGELNNGGHAQFYENEEDARGSLRVMAKLLNEIGLPEHGQLLADFGQLADNNEKLLADRYESGEFMDAKEMFYPLDDRFSHLERSEGRLVDKLSHWLLQQSWVYIEVDHQPADIQRLRSLIPDPPSREERLAASRG